MRRALGFDLTQQTSDSTLGAVCWSLGRIDLQQLYPFAPIKSRRGMRRLPTLGCTKVHRLVL